MNNPTLAFLLTAPALGQLACSEPASPPAAKPATEKETPSPKTPSVEAGARGITGPTLLLAQAQFDWEEVEGRRRPKPGAAKLRLLHAEGAVFSESILEDEESRVFHKAVCLDDGVLTIGATDAHLKLWKLNGNTWRGETLYTGSFGGKFDRLRDFEIGDVDGDGAAEVVIATHDQGVILVLDGQRTEWAATTVFEKKNTFVHEIELGDIDGDGKQEIYATPSKPNRANASQAGTILAVTYNEQRKEYVSAPVVEMETSHAKEVLVTDLDGDGKDELYAAVEASIKPVNGQLSVDHPVAVRRFDKKGKTWKPVDVAEFPDGLQSRVLLSADLTKRGGLDLVVTTMKDGVWRVIPRPDGSFQTVPVDRNSGGFEHAAHAADLDADGTPELYVTSDDDDEVRRYVWNGTGFTKTVIGTLEKSDLVWNITSCRGS